MDMTLDFFFLLNFYVYVGIVLSIYHHGKNNQIGLGFFFLKWSWPKLNEVTKN